MPIPQGDEPFDVKDISFNELLVYMATRTGEKERLVYSIIQNAKEGDASALKMLAQVMESAAFQDDKIKISDVQFKNIIKLAAQRI